LKQKMKGVLRVECRDQGKMREAAKAVRREMGGAPAWVLFPRRDLTTIKKMNRGEGLLRGGRGKVRENHFDVKKRPSQGEEKWKRPYSCWGSPCKRKQQTKQNGGRSGKREIKKKKN